MTTHYRIVDEDGDQVWIGPGRGFSTKTEAALFLVLVPGVPLDWRVEPYDPDALPLPPCPPLES